MSKPACEKQPCELLGNMDFEFPVVIGAFTQINQNLVPCWNTTNPSGLIELWTSGMYPAHGPLPYSGNQYAELNSDAVGKLYQNFLASPGTTITISFAHAGRSGYPNQMFVQIAENIGATPQFSTSVTAIVNTWTVHTFTHVLTGSGPDYTIIFDSPTGGAGGNFLDDIKVTLTPPSITATTNSPCSDPAILEGGSLNLSATATGSGTLSYLWSGPNAFTSNLQNVTISGVTTASAGNYIVSVTDSNGCIATSTVCVGILSSPCYVIKDCNGIQPDFVTNSDFSQYVGLVVKTCINTNPTVKSPNNNPGPGCYTLTNCCDPNEKISIRKQQDSVDPLNWDGYVITSTLPQFTGKCWSVQSVDCTPTPPGFINLVIDASNYSSFTKYVTGSCSECIIKNPDFQQCEQVVTLYSFLNCCTQETIIVGSTSSAHLAPYENQVVTIPSVPELGTSCWTVNKYTGTQGTYSVTVTTANPVTIVAGGCTNTKCGCVENWPDGCYCVTVELAENCTGANPWPGEIFGSYNTCEECTATCYILTDCAGVEDPIIVSNNFSGYVGQIVQLENCNDICWIVSELPKIATCCYDVPYQEVSSAQIIINNETYELPTTNTLNYLNSLGLGTWTAEIIGENLARLCVVGTNDYGDFSYTTDMRSTIISPVCTYITNADCNNSVCVPPVVAAFITCEDCLPAPVPVIPTLNIRRVKPGYNTPGCNPEYTEMVLNGFSDAMFDEMAKARYGVTVCCTESLEYWDIKKQLLDFKAILDPNPELLDIPCTCFTITQLTGRNTYSYISCTGVLSNISLNEGNTVKVCTKLRPCVVNCDNVGTYTLTSSETECTENGDCVVPCYCWSVEVTGPCPYTITNCAGFTQSVNVTLGVNYICSQTQPVPDPVLCKASTIINLGLCSDVILCS